MDFSNSFRFSVEIPRSRVAEMCDAMTRANTVFLVATRDPVKTPGTVKVFVTSGAYQALQQAGLKRLKTHPVPRQRYDDE